MSESQYRPTDPPANGWPHRVASGEELLPPVEPPPAGFILKLFVIPAAIVAVLLAVWQVPKWLVRPATSDPHELIQRLEHGSSIARFQAAFDLAQRLRDDRYRDFRRSPKAAEELGRVLARQMERAGTESGMEEDEIRFRHYLARALGEFEVQEGIGALLAAAETNRDSKERLVRDGAVQAIAVRAYHLRQLSPPQVLSHPELESTLARLSRDEDSVIRSQTAYALGQIGTPWAIQQLEPMVGDPYADARYNAAVALAQLGNDRGAETLAEMLSLEELPSVQEETNELDRANKRAMIVSNAIAAAQELARRNPDSNLSPVVAALERLASADKAALIQVRIPTRVISEVRRTLAQLSSRGN